MIKLINQFYQRCRATGAATLITTVILLVLSALIVIFAAQSGIIQEKMVANASRNYQAFEAAEAGLEFGINYLQKNSAAILASPVSGHLAAYSNSSVTNVTLANNSKFSIVYSNPTANNYKLIQITSTGVSDDSSSTRVVSQLVYFGSMVVSPPTTAFTTQGNVQINSSAQVINLEGSTTVQAGGNVSINGAGKTVLSSGTSSTASSIKSDVSANVSSLDSMSQGDFFTSYFGLPGAAIKSQVTNYFSSGSNSNYSSQLNGLTGTSIWIDQTGGTTTINGNTTIGSSANPVVLIINGSVKFAGNITIYGFVMVLGSATTDVLGSIVVNGSMATEQDAVLAGNATLNYSSSVLTNLQNQSTLSYYAKVAGSWKDF